MAYQQAIFGNGEYYHVYNRGVEKRAVFLDQRDYQRFIQTLQYYQLNNPPTRFSFRNRPVLTLHKHDPSLKVEIISFCLMPNHFHLLLRQAEDGGITSFLSRLLNSYTKYFNTKHKRIGPLFQGSFKAVRIEDDQQLIHVSRYIHLNPLIDYLVKDLKGYEYSSYPQFIGIRKGFCLMNTILDHFKTAHDYQGFVLDQEGYGREIKSIERTLLDGEVSA